MMDGAERRAKAARDQSRERFLMRRLTFKDINDSFIPIIRKIEEISLREKLAQGEQEWQKVKDEH